MPKVSLVLVSYSFQSFTNQLYPIDFSKTHKYTLVQPHRLLYYIQHHNQALQVPVCHVWIIFGVQSIIVYLMSYYHLKMAYFVRFRWNMIKFSFFFVWNTKAKIVQPGLVIKHILFQKYQELIRINQFCFGAQL